MMCYLKIGQNQCFKTPKLKKYELRFFAATVCGIFGIFGISEQFIVFYKYNIFDTSHRIDMNALCEIRHILIRHIVFTSMDYITDLNKQQKKGKV